MRGEGVEEELGKGEERDKTSRRSRDGSGGEGWLTEGRGSGKGRSGVRSSVLGNWVNEKTEKERRCCRRSASAIACSIPVASFHPSFIPLSIPFFPKVLSERYPSLQ